MILKEHHQTTHHQAPHDPNKTVDLLILGAGWTADFLITVIKKQTTPLSYQTTTTSGGGKYDSIKFKFDPNINKNEDTDFNQFESLPDARSILITFPIKDPGASEFLLNGYALSRRSSPGHFLDPGVNIIQLGSSGIFDGGPTLSSKDWDNADKFHAQSIWIDRHSPYDVKNPRAQSEDELLGLNNRTLGSQQVKYQTTVLNLSGLWGGDRSIRKYVGKVAPSIEVLRTKRSVHMIHGLDVARGIVAVLEEFTKAAGQRWLLTDQRVYDWWDLASAWGESSLNNRDSEVTIGPQAKWVNQLMEESNIRALPRSHLQLNRALDSREFWITFCLTPVRARLEHYS